MIREQRDTKKEVEGRQNEGDQWKKEKIICGDIDSFKFNSGSHHFIRFHFDSGSQTERKVKLITRFLYFYFYSKRYLYFLIQFQHFSSVEFDFSSEMSWFILSHVQSLFLYFFFVSFQNPKVVLIKMFMFGMFLHRSFNHAFVILHTKNLKSLSAILLYLSDS